MEEYVAREKKDRPSVKFCLLTTLCWGISWTSNARHKKLISPLSVPCPTPMHTTLLQLSSLQTFLHLQSLHLLSPPAETCSCTILQPRYSSCSSDKSIHYIRGKSLLNPTLGHAHSQTFWSIWFLPPECCSSIHAFHSIIPCAAPGSLWSSL